MGRECRRVPKDWQHPKTEDGDYQPLFDQDFETAASVWKNGLKSWENGQDPDRVKDSAQDMEWWEWAGDPPDRSFYHPKWQESERTHYQMYETCSEGTPISPAFDNHEELAHWLADNGASAMGSLTATYEQWLRVCQGGYAPSGVIVCGGPLRSGVAALHDLETS